jgi:F0F1-type ATP synthase membrane subunit b/b'
MGKMKETREEQSPEEPVRQELLEHLLKIEAEAAVLVDEAQAEVDHRAGEVERQNRARYEERYSQESAALEAAYHREIEGVKAYYKEELEAYRESLGRIKMDKNRFSALMTDFLTRDV